MPPQNFLERFKTEINLIDYAASRGYAIDPRETKGSYFAMVRGEDKLMITLKGGIWVFADNRDGSRGTIIDLVAKLDGLRSGKSIDFSAVIKTLRPWLAPEPQAAIRIAVSYDKVRVRNEWNAATTPATSPYLTEERRLRSDVISAARFAGTWAVNDRGTVLFVHTDSDGVCGFEMKGRGFTGFSPGGQKSLWRSAIDSADQRLVFAESGIDCLSFAQLHPDPHTRYASTGGELSRHQEKEIIAAVATLPAGGTIVLAFDRDAGGDRFAARVSALVPAARFERALPKIGKDWNDVVRAPAIPGR